MIWRLMKIEGVNLRVLMTVVLIVVLLAPSAELGPWFSLPLLLLVLWLSRERISSLEFVLPIPVRTVLAARLLSTAIALAIPFAAWLIVVYVRSASSFSTYSILAIFDIALLCMIAPYLVKPRGVDTLPNKQLLAVWLSVITGGMVVVYGLPDVIAFFALTHLAITGIAVTLRRAPESYVTNVPIAVPPTPSVSLRQHESSSFWWWLVLRDIRLLVVGFFLMFAFFGFAPTHADAALSYTFFLAFVIKPRIAWLAPLPISIRSRTFFTVVTVVALPLAAFTIGTAIGGRFQFARSMRMDSPYASSNYDKAESRTRVPFAYWERFRSTPPVVVSPWGERSPVYAIQLFGQQYYNPYSTMGESSDSFVAWQYARATKAVYGTAFSWDSEGSDEVQYPQRTNNSPRVQLLFTGVMATTFILMLWLMEFVQDRNLIRIRLWDKAAMFIVTIPFIVVMGYQMYVTKTLQNSAEAFVNRGLFRLTQSLPDSIVIATVVAVIPAVAAYFLYEWQAKRTEPERAPSATGP